MTILMWIYIFESFILKLGNFETLHIHGFICIKKESTRYLDSERVQYFDR